MELDYSARALIDYLNASKKPGAAALTVDELRIQSNETRSLLQVDAPVLRSVEDRVVSEFGFDMPIRIYRDDVSCKLPAIVFFHGGGFVIGDLDSHDIVCRQITKESACAVVSVGYRRAPESKYPAAVDDAVNAVQWVIDNADSLGVDADKVIVSGDSAGGNLAANAAIAFRDLGKTNVVMQALIYPVTDQHGHYPSKERYATGYLLPKSSIDFFAGHYFSCDEEKKEWRASPLRHPDLSGLPDTLILTAGFDPLVDEGEAYAMKLIEAGVRVTTRRFTGQVHGFMTRGKVVPEALEAIKDVAAFVRAGLDRA